MTNEIIKPRYMPVGSTVETIYGEGIVQIPTKAFLHLVKYENGVERQLIDFELLRVVKYPENYIEPQSFRHWTKFLPEAGTIYSHRGKYQELELLRISTMEKELNALKERYQDEEQALQKFALTDWSQEEIDNAKAEAQLKPNHP